MPEENNTNGANGTPAAEPAVNSAPAATPAPAPEANNAGTNTGNADNGGNNGGGGTLTGNANEAGAKPAEPVHYDFKALIPEDLEFNQERSDKFVEVIKDMNLSSEQANSIVKYGMDWAHDLIGDIANQLMAERKEWENTALQELGADKDKVLGHVGDAVAYLEKTIPNIRAAFNETGAGNRIEIIRAMALLGQMLQSDPGKAAGTPGVDASHKIDPAYPNTDWSKYVN